MCVCVYIYISSIKLYLNEIIRSFDIFDSYIKVFLFFFTILVRFESLFKDSGTEKKSVKEVEKKKERKKESCESYFC